jgi:hypothetical protein
LQASAGGRSTYTQRPPFVFGRCRGRDKDAGLVLPNGFGALQEALVCEAEAVFGELGELPDERVACCDGLTRKGCTQGCETLG